MIDILDVQCPHCNRGFTVETYFGEEAEHSDAVIVKKQKQQIDWAELDREIQSGYGNAVLSVGDEIHFKLKNGRDVSVTVVAKNLYKDNSVIFAFTDLYWEAKMNERATNAGGWAGSEMCKLLDRDILQQLPDELVSVIKSREITQEISNKSYSVESKLWLPSRTEVFGEHDSYKKCDSGDTQFPGFKNEKLRVKAASGIRQANDGETFYWWLRSPYLGGSTYFWYVYNSGNGYSYNANFVYGVCPCFFI